jgi:hypothetical protein
VIRLFNAFTFCEKFGCLPYAGGMYQQPAKLIESFDVLRIMITERENARQEMIARDNAIKRNGGKRG